MEDSIGLVSAAVKATVSSHSSSPWTASIRRAIRADARSTQSRTFDQFIATQPIAPMAIAPATRYGQRRGRDLTRPTAVAAPTSALLTSSALGSSTLERSTLGISAFDRSTFGISTLVRSTLGISTFD